MRRPLALLAAAMALAWGAEGAPAVVRPNVRYSTVAWPGLEIHLPAAHAARLAPLAARLEALYRRMVADAGWRPSGTLHVALSDDADGHNGFSTVVPLRLVHLQLGPSRPESALFAGHDETIRTAIHEFAHHLSNDRNHGFRATLESLFGRIAPSDPLSLIAFLLSTPNHVLSPPFWHEGVAQWAETAYADPASPWAGRGRDSLVHMVWRLDAAAGGVPPVGEWRLSWHRWPFGERAYHYGAAYARFLAGAFGDRRGMWRMVEEQGRLTTPFAFDDGALAAVGWRHAELLAMARGALAAEQDAALAALRAGGAVATPGRLTPRQWRVAAPAWLDDRTLLHAGDSPYGRPGLHLTDAGGAGTQTAAGRAWMLGNVRAIGGGLAVHADAALGGSPWAGSRVRITDGRRILATLPHERLLMPDARRSPGGWEVAAVRLDGGGGRSLVLAGADGAVRPVPTADQPWSPAFRPGRDELCWVETGAFGSRLVLAGLDGGGRRELWRVPARILHPVWDAAGLRIFCASDVSGVANAWCVPVEGGQPQPVTNAIGGVLAAVPSPDGSRLAVLDHDHDGPFLAVLPLDPAAWPTALPRLAPSWPAPVPRQELGPAAVAGPDRPDPVALAPPAAGPAPVPRPYGGLAQLRPRFWTPTLLAVPEGGLGAVAVATDALLTHTVVLSGGAGYHERTPVGLFAWTYNGWLPGVGLIAKRSELGYDRQIIAADGGLYDYAETVDTMEVRLGAGLGGFSRRWQAYLAGGIDRHRPVVRATDDYAGLAVLDPPAIFTGDERYAEAVLAYDAGILYPTSYAREDGPSLALSARASEPRGNRLLAQAAYSLPVWPEQGHQLVAAGRLGWSDGPRDLQGRFWVGGDRATGLPRGYPLTMAGGRAIEAWSLAYRLGLWRPFSGPGPGPWVTRQAVLEGFWEGARAGDEPGDGRWFRSAGAELHLEFEVWLVRFAPGVGYARQIDGAEDDAGYLALGFRW